MSLEVEPEEKRISTRDFLKLSAITVAALAGCPLGCFKPKEKEKNYQPSNGSPGTPPSPSPPGQPTIQDTLEKNLIDSQYNTLCRIKDTAGYEYYFKRFSLEEAPLLPQDPISDIDRMVATIKDASNNYRLFWFNDIIDIEKQGNNATVHLRGGGSFDGRLVSNQWPINFYNKDQTNLATGMVDENNQDAAKKIHLDNIVSIAFDTSNLFSEFQNSYTSIFQGLNAKKTIELVDGTTLSTNLGYILDCCGHSYKNKWHERLMKFCELVQQDGSIKTAPLWLIDEIELTGNFDNKYPQCREAVIKYKDGSQEQGILNLTSESYGGVCNHSARFRNFDQFLLHQDNGAWLIPLDNIKRIFPQATFDPSKTIKNKKMHEGVTITSWYNSDYLNPDTAKTLDKMLALGVESVAILATQYQNTVNSTSIFSDAIKTPTDAGIENVIARAKLLGMRTVLKPHLDLPDGVPGWRGDISFNTEADWTDWFNDYTTFITHYADLAERNSVDMLVIGTELKGTTHRLEWEQVIDAVRAVYNGEIVYAANHDHYQNIPFWDKLDYIGVDAYFPLTNLSDPTPAELEAAWQQKALELEAFSQLHNKKIILTELGYQSYDGTNKTPWWVSTPIPDEQEQADCFDAAFQACHNKDWCAGIYIWGVYYNMQDPDKFNIGGKKAETTVKKWYN